MWMTGLVALNLTVFEGVLFILLAPPITLADILLNLGIFWLVARPQPFPNAIIGGLLAGLAMVLISALYLWYSVQVMNARAGLIGGALQSVIDWILRSRSTTVLNLAPLLLQVREALIWVEFAAIDLLGILAIIHGGRLERRIRTRLRWQAEPALAVPLDDGATGSL
jgi:hypothetical protein